MTVLCGILIVFGLIDVVAKWFERGPKNQDGGHGGADAPCSETWWKSSTGTDLRLDFRFRSGCGTGDQLFAQDTACRRAPRRRAP